MKTFHFLISSSLVIDKKAREWCTLIYPGHDFGCPNYGIKKTCPPQAPLIENYFNLHKNLWLVAVEFDLAEHAERMKNKHPRWSDRQARCLLYWQPKVNKRLREEVYSFVGRNSLIYTLAPEAMGVNVIQTAENLGLPIERKPIDKIYKIAFVGYAG